MLRYERLQSLSRTYCVLYAYELASLQGKARKSVVDNVERNGKKNAYHPTHTSMIWVTCSDKTRFRRAVHARRLSKGLRVTCRLRLGLILQVAFFFFFMIEFDKLLKKAEEKNDSSQSSSLKDVNVGEYSLRLKWC